MALPDYTVEIAFDSGFSTAAGSRTWTDVSAYVEVDPVVVNRGRPDEGSQPNPSTLRLVLDNRDGRFTPRKTGGAYYPNVKKGRPIRVTSTSNAVDYIRFTGYVSEWVPSWPDSTDGYATCAVSAVSRTARLGRSAELRSIIEEEILTDGPAVYYTLGEPEGSTSAADTSGNQAAALTMVGTGTDVVFGTATGPGTDGLTAATFAGGKYLSGGASVAAGVVECSFSRSGNPSVAEALVVLYDVTAGTRVGIAVDTDGTVTTTGSDLGSSPVVTDGGVHILSWQSGHVLVDGVDIGSPTQNPAAGVLGVGGPLGNFELSGGTPVTTFTGGISHVAVFGSLSTARAAVHAEAGSTGFAGELSGARVERYAGFGGVLAAEVNADAGSATIGHVDSTGQTPIQLMQKVAETENGVLFDGKDGTLEFRDRDARYTVASAFTLSVAAQEVEADLEPKDDDQFMFNDVTATANGVPAGHVIDQTGIDGNGYYRATLDTVTDDLNDALAGAQWKVAKGADPDPRYSTVTVDVTNCSTAQAALILAADIGTRFTLSNLPDQAPATTVDLFVEGYAETITPTSHRITFNTSPAAGYDVWTIEDAVFGQYDAYPIAY